MSSSKSKSSKNFFSKSKDKELPTINSKNQVLKIFSENQAFQLINLDLSDSGLTSLPIEIGNLTHLEDLDLSENKLTSLPIEIGYLTKLFGLDLSHNKLTSLPLTIGNLTQIKGLNLGHNKLTSLPLTIGNLTQLEFLILSHNQLNSLPFEVGNLPKLMALEIDNNPLTSLPSNINPKIIRGTRLLKILELQGSSPLIIKDASLSLDWYHRQINSIQETDKNWLRMYTRHYDELINYCMRNKFLTPFIKQFLEETTRIIHASEPYPEDICLYRGIKISFQKVLHNLNVKDRIEFLGFNSTTLSHSLAESFSKHAVFMKICLPMGTQFVYMEPYTHYDGEEEVLLLPNLDLEYEGLKEGFTVAGDAVQFFEFKSPKFIAHNYSIDYDFELWMMNFIDWYFVDNVVNPSEFVRSFGAIYLNCLRQRDLLREFIQSNIFSEHVQFTVYTHLNAFEHLFHVGNQSILKTGQEKANLPNLAGLSNRIEMTSVITNDEDLFDAKKIGAPGYREKYQIVHKLLNKPDV